MISFECNIMFLREVTRKLLLERSFIQSNPLNDKVFRLNSMTRKQRHNQSALKFFENRASNLTGKTDILGFCHVYHRVDMQ